VWLSFFFADFDLISVLAQVSATIVKPRDDRPYEGFLLINSEISPMASSVYEAGRYVLGFDFAAM